VGGWVRGEVDVSGTNIAAENETKAAMNNDIISFSVERHSCAIIF
jgi:hypothetical protein